MAPTSPSHTMLVLDAVHAFKEGIRSVFQELWALTQIHGQRGQHKHAARIQVAHRQAAQHTTALTSTLTLQWLRQCAHSEIHHAETTLP